MGENKGRIWTNSLEVFVFYICLTFYLILHFKVACLLYTLQHERPTETLTENEEF